MRKLFVLGLLLTASTGCGRGWFSQLFHGAPCNGLCSTPAPTLRNDCEGCASSGYAGYDDGQVVGGAVEGFDPNAIILSQPNAPMSGIPTGPAPAVPGAR